MSETDDKTIPLTTLQGRRKHFAEDAAEALRFHEEQCNGWSVRDFFERKIPELLKYIELLEADNARLLHLLTPKGRTENE